MEENGRYIAIVAGALVLMALALGGAYYLEHRGRITRHSATLDLQRQVVVVQSSSETTVVPGDTTVVVSPAQTDSTTEVPMDKDVLCRQVCRLAEQTCYHWQQKIDAVRFREPAECRLAEMQACGERMRDSLQTLYAARKDVAFLLGKFDAEWQRWYQRLTVQVAMLPTAYDAYEAEQISEAEYKQIQKESTH